MLNKLDQDPLEELEEATEGAAIEGGGWRAGIGEGERDGILGEGVEGILGHPPGVVTGLLMAFVRLK